MKILITGSSGYVGSVLSQYFSQKGIDTTGIDTCKPDIFPDNSHFTFHLTSVTDSDAVKKIFQKTTPTHVIHLAYLMNSLHNKRKEYEIDVQGSKNILHIVDSTPSVKQLVLLSSTSAYGAWPDNPLWIPENHELKPRDYRYGINKKTVEDYYNNYPKKGRFNTVILRMCTLVGPSYTKKGGVVDILTNSPFIPKFNNHECAVQFIHENDLTQIFNLIAKDTEINGTFNLAPDSYATIQELAPAKKNIILPLCFARACVRILWWLRISKAMPSAMTLSTYGIIASPAKIKKYFNYTFTCSTKRAFATTVAARKALGTL